MKHSLSITLIILAIFLAAQFIGIGILYKYGYVKTMGAEKIVVKQTPGLQNPDLQSLGLDEKNPRDWIKALIPLCVAILVGTGVLLLLIKLKLHLVWKAWFLIAVVTSLYKAMWVFLIPSTLMAFSVALILSLWKIFYPNVYIHNFTELFIYGGLAAIFVPLFNVWSVSILLIFIALYDAYAVWHSKHMVTLAKSQAEAKVFAGLLIPYKLPKNTIPKSKKAPATIHVKTKVRTAILGGGDIGFPLMFAGVVMKELGLWQSLIIPFFALLGLGILLFIAKEDKFYPAMPFISGGCLLGLSVVWLIGAI